MTQEKIASVANTYIELLKAKGIPKKQMDPKLKLKDLLETEILAHAHYLLVGVLEYNQDPAKVGKTNRHLASAQMMLSLAGWYTLEELMNHNKP